MASEILLKANDAMLDEDFDAAIQLYTQAISIGDNRAEIYSDRALANIRLKNFTDAVCDADTAIGIDPSNAKAYLRKGMACVGIQDYHTAKLVFENGLKLSPGDLRFSNWLRHFKNCTGGPTKEEHADLNPYRRVFGQGKLEVVLTICAERVPSTCVMVTYEEQMVGVSISVPGERPYFYQPRLFGKIVPARCSYVVDPEKIQIRLTKAENILWKDPVVNSSNDLTGGNQIGSSGKTAISYAESVKSPCPSPKGKGPASPIQSSSSVSPYSTIKRKNCEELDSLKLFKPIVGPRPQNFVPIVPKYSREKVKAPSVALGVQRAAKLLEYDENIGKGERDKAAAAADEASKLAEEFDAQDWKENTYIFHQENHETEESDTRFNLHGLPRSFANTIMRIQMRLAQYTRCDHVLHMYVGKGGVGKDGVDHGTPEIKNDAIKRIDKNNLKRFYEEEPDGSVNEGRLCVRIPHNKMLKLTPDFSAIPTFSYSTPPPSPSTFTRHSTPPTTQTQTQTPP